MSECDGKLTPQRKRSKVSSKEAIRTMTLYQAEPRLFQGVLVAGDCLLCVH